MVWLVCGFLATAGALSFAELGAAIPRTGGTYAFLYRAFGPPLLPFLFGWSMFFVVLTGVMAAVATAFATYAGFFLERVIPYGEWTQRVVAIACILFLTAMNAIGVRVGGKIQVAFTVLKAGRARRCDRARPAHRRRRRRRPPPDAARRALRVQACSPRSARR